MTINEIWEQVKTLTPQERDELMQLMATLTSDPADQLHDIREFEGIGAHLADNEDPQAYVNRMCDEWDNRSR